MEKSFENSTKNSVDLLENHHDERFMYIYIFSGIILTTVVITLSRSFMFFSVSFFSALEHSSCVDNLSEPNCNKQ